MNKHNTTQIDDGWIDETLHSLLRHGNRKPMKFLEAKATIQKQLKRAYDEGYQNGYDDRTLGADHEIEEAEKRAELRKIEWLDEQISHVLFDIYPEEVFTPSTEEDKKRVEEIDQNFVTRLHCDGIRHGLHILRREVRSLSARDDLAQLSKDQEGAK